MDEIALNADLKSTNSTPMKLSSFIRCAKGSGYGILFESICSECILVRVPPGRDVVFDELENQFLNTNSTTGKHSPSTVSATV